MKIIYLGFLCLLTSRQGVADVKLPNIIGDHMVLHKAKDVPIWGKADANEEVTVSIDGQTERATANSEGRWMVKLNMENSAEGPFEMVVQGKNKVSIRDVLIGEVWLGSGQSNMEFMLSQSIDADKEIAKANYPKIRYFRVYPYVGSMSMREDCSGQWLVCTPQTAGNFSAVGYYFSRKLFSELKIPIGLIVNSWGGSPIESWISHDGWEKDPELKAARDRVLGDAKDYTAKKEVFIVNFEKWLKENSREDKGTPNLDDYAGEKVKMDEWKPLGMPSRIFGGEMPECGVVWLRGMVDVGSQVVKTYLPLRLGAIQSFVTIYINGKKYSEETTYRNYPGLGYEYGIYLWGGMFKEGKNTIAIRLHSPFGNPTVVDVKTDFAAFEGGVLAKAELSLTPMDQSLKASMPAVLPNPMPDRDVATYLFNGMNGPIFPYGISGVIWYQGESNAGRAVQYRRAFPMLIEDWRKQWNQPDMPFYFCQLANFMEKRPEPSDSWWAELREAQAMALKLPNTAQAVLIDLGEANDVHPRNKKDVGERLAMPALAKSYAKDIPYSGPVFKSAKVKGDKMEIFFSHVETGLVAKALPEKQVLISMNNATAPLVRNSPQSELEGFAICGEDRRWVWANAKIDGDKVIVWSEGIAKPLAVRYAWADNPTCNLYNGADLPASPFRTDNFPEGSVNGKY